MSDTDDIELVNDSLERCTRRRQEFFEAFYRRFNASSDEVAAKFAGTDLKTQARALRESFYLLLRAIGGDPEAWQALELRAIRHDRRHLDIPPGLYDLWLECLLETIRDFDPKVDGAIEAAWRRTMQQGIDFMIARY
jgi:hemoglobin-like flavoprotein